SGAVVEALAVESGTENAGQIAAMVENDLTRPLQIARTLRDTFLLLERSGVRDRGIYLGLLREVTAANPEYVGTWTIWDGDGFGTLVPDPAGATQGSHPDGSFSPYVLNHAAGGPSIDVLTDYDQPGNG